MSHRVTDAAGPAGHSKTPGDACAAPACGNVDRLDSAGRIRRPELHYGSEGWGFESLRARHRNRRSTPHSSRSSRPLIIALGPAFSQFLTALSDLVNPGQRGLAALQVLLAGVDVGLLGERRVIVTRPLADDRDRHARMLCARHSLRIRCSLLIHGQPCVPVGQVLTSRGWPWRHRCGKIIRSVRRDRHVGGQARSRGDRTCGHS